MKRNEHDQMPGLPAPHDFVKPVKALTMARFYLH